MPMSHSSGCRALLLAPGLSRAGPRPRPPPRDGVGSGRVARTSPKLIPTHIYAMLPTARPCSPRDVCGRGVGAEVDAWPRRGHGHGWGSLWAEALLRHEMHCLRVSCLPHVCAWACACMCTYMWGSDLDLQISPPNGMSMRMMPPVPLPVRCLKAL
jgi:hypothetical protein